MTFTLMLWLLCSSAGLLRTNTFSLTRPYSEEDEEEVDTGTTSPSQHYQSSRKFTHQPSHHTRILCLLLSGLEAAAPGVVPVSLTAAAAAAVFTWWLRCPFLIIVELVIDLNRWGVYVHSDRFEVRWQTGLVDNVWAPVFTARQPVPPQSL